MKRTFSALSPFISILLFCPCILAARETKPSQTAKAKTPFVFVENKGQFIDEHHNRRTDIDFKINAPDIGIFIGQGQVHYQWIRAANSKQGTVNSLQLPDRKSNSSIETYRMDVILEGADISTPAIADDEQEYYENYYLSQCPNGLTAHSYKKVIYKNIYPNIDWVLYTSSKENGPAFKYDFVVHPGGNVKDIKLRYENATALSIKDGSLLAETPLGNITEDKPFSYIEETRQATASKYILKDNMLSFEVENAAGTIIIDPSIGWGTYYGLNLNYVTMGSAVAADAAGNSYLAGTTNFSNLVTSFSAYQYAINNGSNAGGTDAFLVKFSTSGTPLWSTFYGGEGNEQIYALTCDANGNVYMAGATSTITDSNAISTLGCKQRQNGGSFANGQSPMDVFLAKFDGSGARQWGSYYGGTGDDEAYALTLDASGNIIVGGVTTSSSGMASTGAFRTSLAPVNNGFIAKFNSSGSIRSWGTYFAGIVNAVACDSSNNVYAGGSTASYSYIASSTGVFQSTYGGGGLDGFVAQFTATGAEQWGTYYGGTGDDVITALAADVYGNLFVGGYTNSSSNMATAGSFKPAYSALNDGILARFNWSGDRQWATYYGGTGNDMIYGIKCDSSTKIWVSGTTVTTSGMTTTGAYQTSFGGSSPVSSGPPTYGDAFFAEFSLPGVRKYSTYYGGAGDEYNIGLAYGRGKLYLGGTTYSDFGGCSTPNGWQGPLTPPPSPPPPSPMPAGFAAQFNADTALYFRQKFTDTLWCGGDVKQVSIGVINPFRSTNVFTVQLSNDTGGFVNPVNIGSVTANNSGNISFTIPDTTHAGTRYRFRVIASAPADTTFFDNGMNIRISAYPDPKTLLTGPVCAGGTLDLIDTGISPVGTMFSWLGPNNIVSAGTNLHYSNIQFTDSGYYFLIANNYSCIRKDSVHIVPSPNPANPHLFSNGPVCSGDTLKVWATTTTQNVEWYWFRPAGFFPNAPSDTTIVSSAVTDAGVYKAQAIFNGCPSSMDSVIVVVNQSIVPTISVTANPGTVALPGTQVTFTANVTNQGSTPTYQWMKNGTYITGVTGNTYTAVMAIDLHTGDTICVTMTSSVLCPRPISVTACAGVIVDLGVDKKASDELELYPNPNNGNFTINSKNSGMLYVYNIQGQVTTSYKISQGKTNITMPRSASAGVYIGRFVQDNGMASMVKITLQ
jgi:hypothetical protein